LYYCSRSTLHQIHSHLIGTSISEATKLCDRTLGARRGARGRRLLGGAGVVACQPRAALGPRSPQWAGGGWPGWGADRVPAQLAEVEAELARYQEQVVRRVGSRINISEEGYPPSAHVTC
jgi:hypothetical protein